MWLLSHIASFIRGSVGGVTYFPNQWHQIVARERVTPTDPGSAYQLLIRAAFSAAVTAWQTLPAEDRQGWMEYASSLTFRGPGPPPDAYGYQVFLANYSFAHYYNARSAPIPAPDGTPPVLRGYFNAGFVKFGTLNPGQTGVNVILRGDAQEAGYGIMNRSGPLSPGISRYSGPYNPASIRRRAIPAGASRNFTVGGLTSGSLYGFTFRVCSGQNPYRLSERHHLIATAVAY